MGFKPHWDWDLVSGMVENVKNKKCEWDLRIAKWDLEKKTELGNEIGTPPSGLSFEDI